MSRLIHILQRLRVSPRQLPWGLGILCILTAITVYYTRQTSARSVATIDPTQSFPKYSVPLDPVSPSIEQRLPLIGQDAYSPGTDAIAPHDLRSPPPEVLRIGGHVLKSASLEPMSHATVWLYSTTSAHDTHNVTAPPEFESALTDSDGAFTFALPERTWSLYHCYATKIADASGAVLYEGESPLEDGLLFYVDEPIWIRGQLIRQSDPYLTDHMRVSVHTVPDATVWSTAYVGSAMLARDGLFAIEIPNYLQPKRFNLTFQYENAAGMLQVSVPASELLSPEGATISPSFGLLDLTVFNAKKEPVSGATIRIQQLGGDDLLPAETRMTDQGGRIQYLVPCGILELCAYHANYGSTSTTLDLTDLGCTRQHALTLVPTSGRRIKGEVLLSDGAPVENAYVSITPSGHTDATLAALVGDYSDSSGHFDLPRVCDGSMLLNAFHHAYGGIPEATLAPTVDSVRVILEPHCQLIVHLDATQLRTPLPGGPAQYLLSNRDMERYHSGDGFTPLVLSQVPAGRYNLFVRMAGGLAYGQTEVDLHLGQPNIVTVPMAELAAVRGQIGFPNGAPGRDLQVTLRHPKWPAYLVSAWGQTTTDNDGYFELYSAQLDPAPIDVSRNGIMLGHFQISQGQMQALVLP